MGDAERSGTCAGADLQVVSHAHLAAQHNVAQRIARLRSREYRQRNPHIDLERLGVTQLVCFDRLEATPYDIK